MENIKKETAIDWLVNELTRLGHNFKLYKKEIEQAKAMEKEQLEKELISFFLFIIRNNGEHFNGMSIEQFVNKYLEGK